MSRWIFAGAVALLMVLGGSGRSEAGPGPTVTVDASSSIAGIQSINSVFVNTSTSVDILVGSVSDLRAFNFELVYDQTKLSAPTISTGSDLDRNPDANQSFLASTGRTWSCSPPAPSGDTDPSSTVGVAFLSCFSSGAPAGPNAVTGGAVIATVQFNTVALGSSTLTLRNVNTFKVGGGETASCNPTVIVAATCTGATINVVSQSVGGIAELPDVARSVASNDRRTGSSWGTVVAAVGIGGAVLLAVAVLVKKRQRRLS